MSNINKELVEKVALLARLEISSEKAQEMATQLNKILNHFEQISAINTQGVDPLVTPTEIEFRLRDDEVKKELSAEEITANAPDRVGHLFKVPPVV